MNCARPRRGFRAAIRGDSRFIRPSKSWRCGNSREDHTVARESAVKIYDYLQRLFREKRQEITYGPFSLPGQCALSWKESRFSIWEDGHFRAGLRFGGPGRRFGELRLDRVPKEGGSGACLAPG
jgi:hypothetical protein